jgi:tRNA threonylcarbamoyladenosine biosynthesis protein TsaB
MTAAPPPNTMRGMPAALAIETSGRIGSIALMIDGAIVAEDQFQHGLQHAAQMIPMIDRLCQAQRIVAADLKHLYVSAGPGSFTGLRIGITLAKTLWLARGGQVVAVPTVRVLAENAPDEAQHLIIVLDAKRDQIFTAGFDRDASGAWRQAAPAALSDLPTMLAAAARPVYLLGEGIPHHRKFIPDDPAIVVTPEALWRARASVVTRLGQQMAAEGHFADPMTLTPLYVRRPEAEEKWAG